MIIFFSPEDTVIHEFAALALSLMATEFTSKVAIHEAGGVEALIRLLNSPDPDVQKNTIEAVAQLAMDYQARGMVREFGGLQPVMNLMKSDYAIIQRLSLLTLDRLTQDSKFSTCIFACRVHGMVCHINRPYAYHIDILLRRLISQVLI